MYQDQPATRIKICFKSETKKFKKPESYEQLQVLTKKAFGSQLPQDFKYFYFDQEGDLISISCQEDLIEALESMPQLKLVIEESSEAARFAMEQEFSMRSSINLGAGQGFMQPRVNSSFFFEEVVKGREQQEGLQTDRMGERRELGGVQHFGCGTQVLTVEKEMSTQINTNEVGSQIQKDVKEVCVDGSIQTECKGSQMVSQGKEKEVNCQIIQPESQEEQMEQDIVCYSCDGSQVNKKGLPCRRCNGTGKLNSTVLKDLSRMLKDEVKSFTTQSFQHMISDYLQKKAQEQAKETHNGITCDGCDAFPLVGIRYKCSVCNDFDLCEKCEASKNHPHPMLKIRKTGQAPAYFSCLYGEENKKSSMGKKEEKKKVIYNARFVKESFGDRQKVLSRQTFSKSWTFRNNGEHEWPAETLFIQTNGDEMGALSQLINGPVKPGDEISLTIEFTAPELPGKYCAFFRFVHGDNQRFGQKVWCDIMVEEAPKEEVIQPKGSSLLDSQPPEAQQEEALDGKEVPMVEEKQEEQKASEEELLKKLYMEELANSGLTDQKLIENLREMMAMGYYNYKINYNLLKRNNNDLVIAMNKLCNNLVTDTMFEIKQ